MSIGKWIRTKAIGNAALVALIGQRIHPIAAPQEGAMPFVVYVPSISPRDTNKTQVATHDRCNVTFMAAALDFDTLEDINDALRALFDFGQSTAGGITVGAAYYNGTAYSIDDKMEYYIATLTFEFDLKR